VSWCCGTEDSLRIVFLEALLKLIHHRRPSSQIGSMDLIVQTF